MPGARERLEEVLRGLRQRQEQQAEARALWRRALPRCATLARSLGEAVRAQGMAAAVEAEGERLLVSLPPLSLAGHGACAEFRFERGAVEGWRRPFAPSGAEPAEEHFFSLTVRPAARNRPANDFGPGPAPEVAVAVDSQEAFEKAVVDFLEWALVKGGTGGQPVRLP